MATGMRSHRVRLFKTRDSLHAMSAILHAPGCFCMP